MSSGDAPSNAGGVHSSNGDGSLVTAGGSRPTPAVGGTNTGGTNTGGTNTGATNTGATNTGATNTGGTNPDLGVPPIPGSSCAGLAPHCGPAENEDCCASPLLPGGMFHRGEINDNGAPATLSAFRLDRFETTVGRYRNFVIAYDAWRMAGHPAAGEGGHPHTPGTGWDPSWNSRLAVGAPNAATLSQKLACAPGQSTWSDAPGANETRPINCVTWLEAEAFCIWDGGFIPTEAQFNYAQTGGDERRYLPWSSPPSAEQYDRKYASYECSFVGSLDSCLFKVGAHPLGDGRFGQADIGGNVWEWTFDFELEYPVPCQDCSNTVDAASEGRIVRGGGWPNGSSGMRAGYRVGQNPETTYGAGIGFRCARKP